MAQDKKGDADKRLEKREVKTAPELSEQEEQFDKLVETEKEPPVADDAPLEEPVSTQTVPDDVPEKPSGPAVLPPAIPKRSWFKRYLAWLGLHKRVSIPLVIVLLLSVLAAIPYTRYALAGLVFKQRFSVVIVDAETKQPVTSAKVQIDDKETVTDNKGRATVNASVGKATVKVSKKYFKSTEQTLLIPLFEQKDAPELQLQATGRQVSVTVANKIGKKPLANVTIIAADTEAKTDADGMATLVVPAGEEKIEATLTANGFNSSKVTVQVMKSQTDNGFTLTPTGKLYFLSNQSGKLDVVKTNLDGSDRQVVLAGTGREDKPNTSLLASRDWRYLALHARRDSDKAKVYLIDTQTDKLTVVDEGDANFTLTGWSNHHLVYTVERTNMKWNEAKRQALKTFNADTQKLVTLDENASEGESSFEAISGTYILENQIVFAKQWYNVTNPDRKHTINSVNPDGKNKKVVKSYDSRLGNGGISLATKQYGPQEIYIMLEQYGGDQTTYSFEEYERGQIKALQGYTNDQFYNSTYNTYLISPAGDRTFWSEDRDGVQTFFLGNSDGEQEEKIASLAKYNAYGWYSDQYVLIAKEGNQLFIAPRGKLAKEADLTKVADYYRPNRSYQGYGYGYGGL